MYCQTCRQIYFRAFAMIEMKTLELIMKVDYLLLLTSCDLRVLFVDSNSFAKSPRLYYDSKTKLRFVS